LIIIIRQERQNDHPERTHNSHKSYTAMCRNKQKIGPKMRVAEAPILLEQSIHYCTADSKHGAIVEYMARLRSILNVVVPLSDIEPCHLLPAKQACI
jgi:hypothetical protein